MAFKIMILLGMPGMPEMIIIGIVLLLMFGGKKIPELMKGLGQGISEFKKAKNEVDKEIKPD